MGKIKFSIKKIAIKDFFKKHWKRIFTFLIGYIIAVIDPVFFKQFKIIAYNLIIISPSMFWGSYLALIIFTYFVLKAYTKLFASPMFDINNKKSFWKKALTIYGIFCMGFFIGMIVNCIVAYVNVTFNVFFQ